jgi:hypothetical protein
MKGNAALKGGRPRGQALKGGCMPYLRGAHKKRGLNLC